MTSSSSRLRLSALCRLFAIAVMAPSAYAALGEAESHVEQDRVHIAAQRSTSQHFGYRKHRLDRPDSTRVHQYVGNHGQVFAVAWQTPYKPDMDQLLGASAPRYAQAVAQAARKGGIQRQFRFEDGDVVVQSNAYLNRHSGYAYRPSLVPAGFALSQLARD